MGKEPCFGEGDLLISSLYPLFHTCLRPLHSGAPLPLPPCSLSLSSSCAPLQPTRAPSKRRRGLASVWSAQGGSVCTQSLPS